MTEKTCQTTPIDWKKIRTKCPCCGTLMRLVVNWNQSDGVQCELQPLTHLITSNESKIDTSCNNSLMNIVSVSESRLKNNMSDISGANVGYRLNGDDTDDTHVQNSHTVTNCLGTCHPQSQINTVVVQQQNHQQQLLQQQQQLRKHQSVHAIVNNRLPPSHTSNKTELVSIVPVFDQFRNHVTQSSIQKFKCEVNGCGQSFANCQQLDLHYKEHKGEKIQKCDWYDCNRLFSSKEKLRNHIRCRHTGERPFKCEVCGKAFTSPKHLKDHRLLHTDERPFECDWEGCSQKFRRRHHLVAHKRVHTKERPYNCQYPGCERNFSKSHHLKRHHETHFKFRGSSGGQSVVETSQPTTSMLLPTGASSLVAAAASSSSPAAISSTITSLMNSYAFPAL